MSNKDYNKIAVKNNMEVNKGAENNLSSQTGEGAAERPKLQGVVGRSPKKIKRSLFSRLITGLVGPDGAAGIGGYISEEIIKPAVKNIIFDSLTSGISMALFGDRGGPNRGSRTYYGSDNRPRTNYNSAYSSRPSGERSYGQSSTTEPRSTAVARPSRYGVEEYIIEDRHDAAYVLTSLSECADKYGLVSVADYYDLIKVTSNFTDNSYGWRHEAIVAARIVPVRGGWVIKFPPVEAL